MVNDDLLKVKIDVQTETQETFMRRVKVRPFTFPPLYHHPWKVKVKSESTSFHFSWKVKVCTFTFLLYHHQRSPTASCTVTNVSKWKYVLSLYISSKCLLYSFCILLIISKCDVFQYVVWGNFIKSVPVRIALLRHRYSPEFEISWSSQFSRSFWK